MLTVNYITKNWRNAEITGCNATKAIVSLKEDRHLRVRDTFND